MTSETTAAAPFSGASEDKGPSYEALKLSGLIRSGSALAALVLAYSMEWMNLFGALDEISRAHTTGVSVSPLSGARQSVVLRPGDMEVFGIPMSVAFACVVLAGVLRVVYPRHRRLHPLVPFTLAAPGTIMLGAILWFAIQDETAQFFTSGFYVALAAFALNSIFDFIEFLDWRRLGKDRSAAEPTRVAAEMSS
jgi:hypothetical protein